jgi:alpha-methylacyl-CoA racemase
LPLRSGPLADLKIIELASIGPGPFCGMLLADLGAEVIRVERPGGDQNGMPVSRRFDVPARGRRTLVLDLKAPGAADVVLDLAASADALIEGYRPGVAERLGIGPIPCHERNPRLVYGRMTGFGQTGPLAQAAGHDINYIALSGALAAMGRNGAPPAPPLNLVGDYGGGALYLAFGLLAGIHAARTSGRGDVIDVAMVDGVASLMALFCGLSGAGRWSPHRADNLVDGGAPFYDTYKTADGLFLAVGPLEPKFFATLAQLIGLEDEDVARQYDRTHWPALRARMTAIFKTRTRADWCGLLEGTDACVTPVLDLTEAAHHPHMAARGSFVEVADLTMPGIAPRFATHKPDPPAPPSAGGESPEAILHEHGMSAERLARLRAAGAFG